jgi:hypothetical protein
MKINKLMILFHFQLQGLALYYYETYANFLKKVGQTNCYIITFEVDQKKFIMSCRDLTTPGIKKFNYKNLRFPNILVQTVEN